MDKVRDIVEAAGLEPQEKFGVLIRFLRKRMGMHQSDLASQAGTSQPVVSGIERGRDLRASDVDRMLLCLYMNGEERIAVRPLVEKIISQRTPHQNGFLILEQYVDFIARADRVDSYAAFFSFPYQTLGYYKAMMSVFIREGNDERRHEEKVRSFAPWREKLQRKYFAMSPRPAFGMTVPRSALTHRLGDPQVMIEQLTLIKSKAQEGSVVFRVLPDTILAPVRFLTRIENGPEKLIVNELLRLNQVYSDWPRPPRYYECFLDSLPSEALSQDESIEILQQELKTLER